MPYNWQCIAGHSGEIPEGSLLEAKAKVRESKGFLDAIGISTKECLQCEDDRIERLRQEARMCGDFGCPLGESDCDNGCRAARQLNEVIAATL